MLFIFFVSEIEISSESSSPSDLWQEEAAQVENVILGVKLGCRAILFTDSLDVHGYCI